MMMPLEGCDSVPDDSTGLEQILTYLLLVRMVDSDVMLETCQLPVVVDLLDSIQAEVSPVLQKEEESLVVCSELMMAVKGCDSVLHDLTGR